MSCEKHKRIPDKYSGGSLKELAEDIGNMHYEALEELLFELSIKIDEDAEKDSKRGRIKLNTALIRASVKIKHASEHISEAWVISKPFML